MGMTLVRVHRALSHGWRTLEAATAEKEPSVLTRAHKCAASVAPPPQDTPRTFHSQLCRSETLHSRSPF